MRRAALAVLLVAACGGTLHPRASAAHFPVLALVPADATWVVTVARLDRGARLLRDLHRPFGVLDGANRPEALDATWRARLGVSPFSGGDLADHGFAAGGSAVLYSTGVLPTLILPVADAEKVDALLERAVRDATVHTTDRRGVHLTTLHDHGDRVSWAILDGRWLVVHVHEPASDLEPFGWLDRLQAGGFAATEDAVWALALAGARRDALAVVRYPRFIDAVDVFGHAPRDCPAYAAWARARFGRLAGFAALADGRVDAGAFFETTTRPALPAPPDAAFATLARAAAVYLSLNVDPGAVLGAPPPGGEGCERIADVLSLVPRGLLDALPGVAALRVAVLAAAELRQDVDLRAAAWLTPAEDGALAALLAGGADIPLPHIAAPLEQRLDGAVLRLAVGAGVMDRLRAGGGAPPDGELFAVAFDGDRLGDARPLFMSLIYALGGDAAERPLADAAARFVAQLRRFVLRFTLVEGGIRMEAGIELR